MPLFKTGHQPKTYMALTPSEFRIDGEIRKPYEESVGDTNIDADERMLRAAITIWAEKQKPGAVQWIYTWIPQ